MTTDYIWSEKYRPQTVDQCILPPELSSRLQEVVDSGNIQNMLFVGPTGVGKTTVARAIGKQLNRDVLFINGSEQGNIDTLRGKIRQFASSISLTGNAKLVILDEADYLNAQSTQPALRGFMEEFSSNCRFILTCNFKNRLIEPLQGRCATYDFNISKKQIDAMALLMYKRVKTILEQENIEYERADIVNMIVRYVPDWRRTINEIQKASASGVLNTSISIASQNNNILELIKYLKAKNFKEMRKWVVENIDLDTTAIFRGLYDNMYNSIESKSIPQLVIILADYQYKDAFVSDHELNIVACLTEVMSQVEFK